MMDIKLNNISSNQTETYDVVVDGQVVGFCQLRLNKTKSEDMPDGFESNIYYEIFPEFRNQGYATEMLKELLKRANDLGMEDVIVTIADDNEASKKVAEKNGAELLETAKSKDGKIYGKYKIDYNMAYGRRTK